jgi:23S rRNA pseudouridine2457 synthase
MLIAFNKPYGVLCQFRRDGDRPTLADFINVPKVYPAGRLDRDSEGLLLLTDEGPLQHRIAHPKLKLPKTYWVQVERDPGPEAIATLCSGVVIEGQKTLPAIAQAISEPESLWTRDPPVRFRKTVPTAWIALTLREGRNRQVRKMTAAVGHPTLRLIRARIGDLSLGALQAGEWAVVPVGSLFSTPAAATPERRR